MKKKCQATGKVTFETYGEARNALLRIRLAWKYHTVDGKRSKHRVGKPAQKRVYYCPHCGGYHLTHWVVYEDSKGLSAYVIDGVVTIKSNSKLRWIRLLT
jgi:hypothetical protein